MTEQQKAEAVARVRAAAAAHGEDYVSVTAADLAALYAAAGTPDHPLAAHARRVAETDPARRISVHRTAHLADVLAKVPA